MTIVSNSDIETWQKCERMFYYSRLYRGGIRPKVLPPALKRGSFGHEMFEVAFKVLIQGGNEDEATQAAGILLTELMESDEPDVAEMMGAFRLVCAFISYVYSDSCTWRPVAIEDKGMWNLSDDRIFAFTPDIIVEFDKGLYKGQHAVLDYKFIGQYMKEIAIDMAQQIPKYMIYRNKIHPDFKIHRGAFIQLNTRAQVGATGHKLFIIKWIEPTKIRLERIEYENSIWVERVAQAYENPDADYLRTVNKDVCNWCFFGEKGLCQAEFDGKPQPFIDKIVSREFTKNDYGYHQPEEIKPEEVVNAN